MLKSITLLLFLGAIFAESEYSVTIRENLVSISSADGKTFRDFRSENDTACTVIIKSCDNKIALYELLAQLLENKCYPSIYHKIKDPKSRIDDSFAAYALIYQKMGKEKANSAFEATGGNYVDWITK